MGIWWKCSKVSFKVDATGPLSGINGTWVSLWLFLMRRHQVMILDMGDNNWGTPEFDILLGFFFVCRLLDKLTGFFFFIYYLFFSLTQKGIILPFVFLLLLGDKNQHDLICCPSLVFSVRVYRICRNILLVTCLIFISIYLWFMWMNAADVIDCMYFE